MGSPAEPVPYTEDDERNPFAKRIKTVATQKLDGDQKQFIRRVVLVLAMQWITVATFAFIFYFRLVQGQMIFYGNLCNNTFIPTLQYTSS